MITWTVAVSMVFVIGVNTLLWGIVSVIRAAARPRRHRVAGRHRVAAAPRFRDEDVAILMAAHNEAAVLANSLRGALALLPPSQIHVVSDGSSDRTVEIAQEFGVNVLDLQPNRGKAGALAAGIEHFDLKSRFQVVLLLDADTRLSSDYLTTGLPCFDDPDVVAVSGVVKTLMDPLPRTRTGRFLLAHRTKIYAVTQQLVKFGQAAKWVNVMPIIPGFASMYRTDILSQIDITRPGLVLEDINMTFEIHTKKLGRVAFHPNVAVGFTQDPDNWRDYVRQVHRWTLGYWQTIGVHRRHFGKFWVSVALQAIELITNGIVGMAMVPLLLFTVYSDTLAHTYGYPQVMGHVVVSTVHPYQFLLGFLLPDMLLVVFAATSWRRPGLLPLILLLPLMRFVDAYVTLWALSTAFRTRRASGRFTGHWVSPTRRATSTVPSAKPPQTNTASSTDGVPGQHHAVAIEKTLQHNNKFGAPLCMQ